MWNRQILKNREILQTFHCKPIPVMRTGFSLCSISNREKPVFITGIPANENRFFPVWKYYTGKTLFWPCTGPVRDCSVLSLELDNSLSYLSISFLCNSGCFGAFLTSAMTSTGNTERRTRCFILPACFKVTTSSPVKDRMKGCH